MLFINGEQVVIQYAETAGIPTVDRGTLEVEGAVQAELRLRDTSQTAPAGRYRLRSVSDTLTIDRAAASTGNPWDSATTLMSFAGSGALTLTVTDVNTNTTLTALTLNRNVTSGAGAASLGVRLALGLESTTTINTLAAAIDAVWTTATHATRTADLIMQVVVSATTTEAGRIDGSGSAWVIGNGDGGLTAPTGWTFRAPDAAAGGAGNVAGADLTIAAGLGTGTGDEGTIIFSLPIVAAAGDNIQTRATRMTLDMVGSSTVLSMVAAQALTISTAAGDLTLNSAGNDIIFQFGGTEGMRLASDQLIIGDGTTTAAPVQTGPALVIDATSSIVADPFFEALDRGITHGGLTGAYGTGTLFGIRQTNATNGGIIFDAFQSNDSGSADGNALIVQGLIEANADTTKSTAGRAIFEVAGYQLNGAGTVANIVANGNVFGVKARRGGGDITVLIVDEDGDLWLDGAITTTGNLSLDGDLNFVGAQSITTTTGALGLTSGDGAVNVTTGSGAADDFTVNTSALVVEGDTSNVGIGTTGPINKLSVNAAHGAASTGTTPNGAILVGSPTSSVSLSIGIDGTVGGNYPTYIQSRDSTAASWYSLLLNPNGGNVGIGTAAPQSLLDVQGAAGAAGILTLATKELTVVATDVLGRINFNAPLESDGGDAILVGAAIWAVATDTFSATVNTTDLVFATAVSEAAAEKMRLTSAGNVGIGTATVGTGATYNLALGGGATSPVLGAATADIVHLAAVDVAAGNRQLYIQSETGSPICLGADALTFGAAADIVAPAATAAALEISNGTVKMLALDTRATTDNIAMLLVTSIPPTFASAAASTYHLVESAAFVLTLTGQVAAPTDLRGLVLSLGAPTVTDASAITPTRASTVYIPAITYGGSVTPSTTNLIIDTSVAGCYLTAAGVWTDASTRTAKQDIRTLGVDIPWDDVLKDIQEAQSVSFRKIDPSDGGWKRYGVIAEDVPDYLAMPDRQGVASMYLAGAAFAGVQALIYENEQLKLRIAKLEGARA